MSLACYVGIAAPASGTPTPQLQAQLTRMTLADRAMVENFMPELQQKFFALAPELRASPGDLHASHTRHSKDLTLRQAMQEILSEYQGIVAAVTTDHSEQAADRGSMAEAAKHLGEIASGCVACQEFFRGRPGISKLLLPDGRR